MQRLLLRLLGCTLPLKRPVSVVGKHFGPLQRPLVGQPIEVVRVDHPTDEQIHELQTQYTAALMELYRANAGRFGNPKVELSTVK